MNTLHVALPFDDDCGISFPQLVLQRIPTKHGLHSECYNITDVEELHQSRYTTVYRALMGVTSTEKRAVVLKTDIYARNPRPKSFLQEVLMYERMEKIQGRIIPRCYGLYQTQRNGCLVSLLVLDDCGDCIEDTVDDLPLAFREKAINKLYSLHKMGFAHGDLDLRNIWNKDGEPFFIDLEFAKAHKCRVRQRIFMDDLPPAIQDFGCKEIFELALTLCLWASSTVDWFGYSFNRHSVSWDLLDDMVHKMRFFISSDAHRERVRESLKSLVEEVEAQRAWCESITDEERYFFPPPPELTSEDEDDENYPCC